MTDARRPGPRAGRVELVRGQNHPLDRSRVDVRIAAADPVLAGVLLGAEESGRRTGRRVLHPGDPVADGVEVPRQAAAEHRIAVDLAALPAEIAHVAVFLALPPLPGAPARFGGREAPVTTVTGDDGAELAGCTATGLDAETALVTVELYRRGGSWKVRAVGQGYAGGLPDLFRDHRLEGGAELARRIGAAVRAGAERRVEPPPPAGGARQRRSTIAGSAGAARPAGPGAESEEPGETAGRIDYRHPRRPPSPRARSSQPPAGDDAPAGPPPAPDAAEAADHRHPRRESAGAPRPAAGPGAPADRPQAPATGPGPAAAAGTAPPPGDASVPAPVAGDANGWTFEERLYNQLWGVFEDAARSAAAYRSAADFAESRMDRELDEVLADPATRTGPAGDAAQRAARERRAALVDRARQIRDGDTARLLAELRVVEEALPPALARWDHPGWAGWKPPQEPAYAVRLGDVHLDDEPDLRIPLTVRLPQRRGLWVDAGRPDPGAAPPPTAEGVKQAALETAAAIAVRLLASHPPGEFTVHAVDPGGSGAAALAPLSANGLLAGEPATGAAEVERLLDGLVERVDLVQMAQRNDAVDALPPHLDLTHRLLLVHEFPYGFDDRTVGRLRYLADEGPSVGVQMLLVADRDDARAYGPVLDPLWRALLRLTPAPSEHLADPWVGHAWTYTPLLPPAGGRVFGEVCRAIGAALRTRA